MRCRQRIKPLAHCALFVLVASVPATAAPVTYPTTRAPSALELYRQSFAADLRFSYSGHEFITVWRDDDSAIATATMVDHRAPSDTSITYTAPPSRRGRVILEHNQQEWTMIPQQGIIVHSANTVDAAQPKPTAMVRLLLSNYTLSASAKSATIAGRKTFIVSLMPHAAGRPYDKLWIDPYTGLVLRREKYHSDASMASVSYFSDIRVAPAQGQTQFVPTVLSSLHGRLVEEPVSKETSIDPATLPTVFVGKAVVQNTLLGFALQRITLMGMNGAASLHLLYSDGLNAMSLFETIRTGTSSTRLPLSHRIAIAPNEPGRMLQRYSYSILSWDSPKINYTLVGDLSPRTLVDVARASGTIPPPAPPQTRPLQRNGNLKR